MQVQNSLDTSTLKRPTQIKQGPYFTPIAPKKESSPARAALESSLSMRSTTGQLKNGLNYCLTSQPDAITSTTALVVASGSNSNPPQWPGLAHAVEHNTFVKNTRFKKPYEYLDFITSHGGICNAVTSHQNTTYYFQIRNNNLREAQTVFETDLAEGLERLSASLKSPLFEKKYIETEKIAIDHEFHEQSLKPWFETMTLLNQVLSQEHPETRLSCGNAETLSNKPEESLQEALERFFKQHYTANNMSIAIHSPYSLEDQQKLLEHYFLSLSAQPKTQPIHQSSFLSHIQTPLSLEVKPRLLTSNIMLFFCVPSFYTALKHLTAIFNNDNDGSLKQCLRDQDLISSCEAYIERSNSNECMLGFQFDLAAKDSQEAKDVKQAFFQFIKNMKQALRTSSTPSWLSKNDTHTHHAHQLFTPPTIMDTTLNAAHSLARYEQARPVRDPNVLFQMKMILNKISEDKVIEIIENPKLKSGTQAPFSEITYKASDYQPAQMSNALYTIELPSSDQYARPITSMVTDKANNECSRILSTDKVQVWHQSNTQDSSPVVLTSLLFSKKYICDVQANTLYHLWSTALKPTSSKTAMLGISLTLEQRNNNYEFKIKSAETHLPILLKDIKDLIQHSLTSVSMSPSQVNSIKQKQIQYFGTLSITDHVKAAIKNSLLNLEYNPQKNISALSQGNIQKHIQTWHNQAQANILMLGSISEKTAETLGNLFTNLISNSYSKTPNQLTEPNFKKIHLINTSLYLPSSKTGYCLYIQLKNHTPKTVATFLLLSKLLSTSFFREMRVNKHLGYSTDISQLQIINTSGIAFTIEGHKTTPEKMEKEITSFLKSSFTTLNPNEFQLYKDAAIKTLKEKPNTLPHIHKDNLVAIEKKSSDNTYYSDETLATTLEQLTLTDTKNIFNNNFLEQPQGVAVLIGSQEQETYARRDEVVLFS